MVGDTEMGCKARALIGWVENDASELEKCKVKTDEAGVSVGICSCM